MRKLPVAFILIAAMFGGAVGVGAHPIPNLITAKFAGMEQAQDGCAMNSYELSYLAH